MDIFTHTIRQNRFLILVSCVAGLASGLATTALIHLINQRMNGTAVFSVSGWVFGFVLLAAFLGSILAKFSLNRMGAQVIHSLRERMVGGVLSTPYAKVEAVGPARIYATLTEDLDALASVFGLLPGLLFSSVLVCGGLAYLIYLSPIHVFVVVGVVGLGVAISVAVKVRADHLLQLCRHLKDELFTVFDAMLQGRKELQLNRHRQESFYAHYESEVATPLRESTVKAHNWLSIIEEFAGLFALLAIGAVIFDLAFLGSLSGAAKSGYVITILFIHGPIRTIFDGARVVLRCRISLRKIRSLEIFEDGRSQPDVSTDIEDACSLELRGVRYQYDGDGVDDCFALGPINLTVRAGEIVFIVGGNGSGKSTLAKVLTGLYGELDGEIMVDGQVLARLSRAWYCNQFAAVFSDFYLFDRVLGRDGRVVDDEVIREHLRQLRIDHKVGVSHGRLHMGKLSTGQSKRLAFLLARMEDKRFYLFDEWAAEQDVNFREFFYKALLPELKQEHKAIICITHDARYLHVADRVLRMEDGRLTPVAREDVLKADASNIVFGREAG